MPIRFLLATVVSMVLFGCESQNPSPIGPVQVDHMEDIQVPDGFDFSMKQQLTLDAVVLASPFKGKVVVDIYRLDGANGKSILHTFIAQPLDTSRVTIVAPKALTGLFLDATLSTGKVLKSQIPIVEGAIPLAIMVDHVDDWMPSHASGSVAKMTTSGPGCTTGCNTTITSVSGNVLQIPSGDTYCITGGLTNKKVVVGQNATARFCGTFSNVQKITLSSGAKLVLNDNASLTMNNGHVIEFGPNATAEIYAGATLTTRKTLIANQTNTITNHGTLNVTGEDFEVGSGSSVVNNGTVFVGKRSLIISGTGSFSNTGTLELDEEDLKLEDDAALTNDGDIDLTEGQLDINDDAVLTNNNSVVIADFSNGDLILSNQGSLVNNCYVSVSTNVEINGSGEAENNAAIYVAGDLSVQSSASLTMDQQSLILVGGDFDALGTITGLGTATSLIKVSGTVSSGSSAAVTGDLSVSQAGTINWNGATLGASVVNDANTYIPTSSCVTQGNGTPTVADCDNDGIPDATDDFPCDAERVATMVGGINTIIAEDKWPFVGDYDFNDMVMLYQFNPTIDAQSKIKDLVFRYKIQARGAGFDNGFGFTMTVNESNVVSTTGGITTNNLASYNANGTETGAFSNGAGFIVTDRLEDNLQNWNTVPGAVQSSVPVWTEFKIVFDTAIDASLLQTFNPFLIKDQIRGHEIHMVNYDPTDLADVQVFGTWDDNTDVSVGRTYVNTTGLPWMMDVPTGFNYVIEQEDLTQAYLKFATWVSSGGTLNQDWYDATKASNINASKLYN